MSLSLADVHGIFGGDLRGDRVHAPSPGHSPHDRGMILRLRHDGRGVFVYLFNGDWKHAQRYVETELRCRGFVSADVRAPTAAERKAFAQAAAKAEAERKTRQLTKMHTVACEGTAPEPGGPVRNYGAARGLPSAVMAMGINSGAIWEHRDEFKRPSMLVLSHDLSGRLSAVQLTKLKPDGSGKRGSSIDRLTFGVPSGAAARLIKFTGDTLAVAEGTETALAFFALRGVPTWATFGTRNLAAFEPPRNVRTLIIAADGDKADPSRPGDFKGMDAAEALFDRLKSRVRVVIEAAPQGLDWLDVLNAGGATPDNTGRKQGEAAACR